MLASATTIISIFCGNGYFDVDGILPLKTILSQSLMCVYIAIIATTLQVMLRRVDSASALKSYSYELECWLAIQEGLVCECTG